MWCMLRGGPGAGVRPADTETEKSKPEPAAMRDSRCRDDPYFYKLTTIIYIIHIHSRSNRQSAERALSAPCDETSVQCRQASPSLIIPRKETPLKAPSYKSIYTKSLNAPPPHAPAAPSIRRPIAAWPTCT